MRIPSIVPALVAGLVLGLPASAQSDLAARITTYAPLMLVEKTNALHDAGPMLPPDPALVEEAEGIFASVLKAARARYPGATLNTLGLTITTAPDISAYALLGGHIVFSTSLVRDLGLTKAEFAAVIAHELGHVFLAHGQARMAWVEANTRPGRDARELIADFSKLIWDHPELQEISRRGEFAADVIAVQFLLDAGFDPSALASLLDKVMDVYGNGEDVAHPAPGDRLTRVLRLLPDLPVVP